LRKKDSQLNTIARLSLGYSIGDIQMSAMLEELGQVSVVDGAERAVVEERKQLESDARRILSTLPFEFDDFDLDVSEDGRTRQYRFPYKRDTYIVTFRRNRSNHWDHGTLTHVSHRS
jgi:hypothetical protein